MKHPDSRLKSFVRTYSSEIRFFVVFVLLFLLGQLIYYVVNEYTGSVLIHRLDASVSCRVLNLVTPGEKVVAEGAVIRSGAFQLTIAKGCEGTEGVIILVAALLAFPMGLRGKIGGVLAGALVIYGSNLFRIVGLYYVLKYRPEFFDLAHIYAGQVFIIFIALMFFVFWTSRGGSVWKLRSDARG